MTTQRNYSKAALVLAAGAFLLSAANAGAPALAKAMAGNSDTVDGFDAVKASTPVKHRRGKLVATSPKNGRLPNNIIKVAPNAKNLAGHPSSYFLGSAAANALFETGAHAEATYETKAHAGATYETKVEAAATQDQLFSLKLADEPPVPTQPERYFALLQATLNLPAPGKVRLQTSLRTTVTCIAVTIVGSWLTVDGDYVPGSLFTFGHGQPATAVLDGITASPLSAGPHQVQVRVGCIGTTWASAINNSGQSGIVATLLRGGAS